MPPNNRRHAVLVLGQPGAHDFFNPVLPVLRSGDWKVTVLDGTAAGTDIASTDPDVVVTSTSYKPAEKAALEWAIEQGVPTAQLVESWYDYRLRIEMTDGPGLMPNEIWVVDDTAKVDAAAEGLPAERIRSVGHPAWEIVSPLPDAPVANVLLIDQPLSADVGRRLGYDENDFFDLVCTGLGSAYRVALALHPRRDAPPAGSGRRFTTVQGARNAVKSCGTVIGMCSTFLVEAFLAGRRVVSVQPNAKGEDFCILSRLDLIPRVTALEQLAGAIASAEPGPRGFDRRFKGSRARVAEAFAVLAA